MSIEDRNLKPGARLVARYKKQEYSCEVVKTKDGVIYRLEDSTEYKSLSSAGSAVMGGSACNGWRFWSLASEAKKAAKKASSIFEPMADQTGAADGQVRYFCSACMDSFEAPTGVTPIGCPQAHAAE